MLEIPERSLLDQQAKSNDIRFLPSVAIVTIGAAVLFWLIAGFYHTGLSNSSPDQAVASLSLLGP